MTKFETEISVRPNEIDINRHVHQSVYLDYILFARFDQMKRCYKMSMEEFFKMGYSWTTKAIHLEFIKPICLGETVIVRTWVEEVRKKSVKVSYQILKKGTKEIVTEGWGVYVLIGISTGKPEIIPEKVIKKYSI
ncbi:MAG: acyl-CoA thioesterase [Candidatus Aminicenantes bacterium]|nr:MAG: acyl-CoA thioesterase [Candidatus Aminicenantes bacterium]